MARLTGRTKRRWPSWAKQLVPTVVLYGALAAFLALGIFGHAEAVRSSYTQAHGVQDNATVAAVDNTEVTGSRNGPGTWLAQVTVDLDQPVDGVNTSVVHVPYKDRYAEGDTITVLVDPRDPGYAELPGSPFADIRSWIWWVVVSLGALALALWSTLRTVILFSRRRAAPGLPSDYVHGAKRKRSPGRPGR
jgi:hypothetical protein